MSPSANRHRAARIIDPVMLCMVVAVILAVGTSIALRVVVSGPAAAHASDSYSSVNVQPRPPANAPVLPTSQAPASTNH